MSILTAHHVSKAYGAQDVLRDVTIALAHGQRAALVGPNGVGKTTLLHILAGMEEPNGGAVHRARGQTIGFLPQHADQLLSEPIALFDLMRAVFAQLDGLAHHMRDLEHALADPDLHDAAHEAALEKYGKIAEQFENAGGYTFELRIQQVLSGVGFDQSDWARPVNIFSGGQKTRALLARLILQQPDVLLLDEPTNHLDVGAVEWLEATLKDYAGSIIVVSHDRYFIDAIADTVWELKVGGVEAYRGNYTHYLIQREERFERQLKEYEKQQAFIAKEEDYIRRNMAGQNTRQAQGRRTRLERLQQSADLVNRPEARKSLRLNLATQQRSGDIVLRARHLVIGYQDDRKPLLECDQLYLYRNQRVAIWGPNGAGKSTFLKTALGQIPPLKGEIELGASVKVGYYAQAHEMLNPDDSMLNAILKVQNMPVSKARGLLGSYLFSGDMIDKRISDLSGGERGRVALAVLALQGANVLLLDEPTNHLDLDSQEVLQDVLADFDGTLLLVTHDRYLVDALATHVWAIEDNRIVVYDGNYSEFSVARTAARAKAEVKPEPQKPVQAPIKSKPDKAEKQRQKRAADLESAISELETRLTELSRQLEHAKPDQVAALGTDYTKAEQQMQALIDEWAEIAA
ncbi:MAG: ABC-F family ATP-binding cassette domain-containing protein [Chloroflexi bacterium]|nr:ABC-F family ATP-binding cassette domain-containing protein [Chloroflexota bacterium]